MVKWIIAPVALVLGLTAMPVYHLVHAASPVVALATKTIPTGPDAYTVVEASLKGIQGQNVITPLVARYVAVVTSHQSSLGGVFDSQKTLILPATARYEINLADIHKDDLAWDAASKTLRVHLPPVRVSGLEIDMTRMQEYSSGVLTSLESVNKSLDGENRRQAQQQILDQANQKQNIALAQNAAAAAVRQNFSTPLRVAGIPANVEVTF